MSTRTAIVLGVRCLSLTWIALNLLAQQPASQPATQQPSQGWPPDWYEGEFWPSFIRWRKLNIDKVAELSTGSRCTNGAWDEHPDLSKVDEVGFADLLPGSGHGTGGYIELGPIEVYGKSVPRDAATSSR